MPRTAAQLTINLFQVRRAPTRAASYDLTRHECRSLCKVIARVVDRVSSPMSEDDYLAVVSAYRKLKARRAGRKGR